MMNRFAPAILSFAILVPTVSSANDFPTSARAEYVLECLKDSKEKAESLKECSCEVDQIASQLKYDDYIEMSTALRYQSLGGDRGAEFRDPEGIRTMAKKYKDIQQSAKVTCTAD